MGGLHLGLSSTLSLSSGGGGGGGGVVAPVLTAPTDTITGSTTATITVDTDQAAGTLYWVMSTSGTPPSAAQVKAGQDSGGGAAAAAGNQAVVGTGTQSANVTGLTAATAYFAYFMHENTAQSNVAAATTKTTWNTETQTWKTAVVGDGGSVTTARGQLVDNLITSLKSGSVFVLLDRLYLLAAENTQSALRDIVSAAQASLVDAPTFIADRGYTTDGTNDAININFNPATAPSPKYVQNSGAISFWSRTTGQTANSGMGSSNLATMSLNARNTSDTTTWRVNQVTPDIVAGTTDGSGLFTATRTGAAATQAFRNSASLGTGSNVSSAPSNATTTLGEFSIAFSSRQFAAAGIGSGRDLTLESAFYNAMQTYMTAVGA